jgi:hypothetical protein
MTRIQFLTVAGLILASCCAAPAGADDPVKQRVDVTPRVEERRVDVLVDGRPFTSYIWPERLAKPVFYPVRTARGTVVTRGFPIEPRPGERADHPHQVGFWLTFGDVNGVDFWGTSEAIEPQERAKMGVIRHREVAAARGGAGRGELSVRLDWVMPGGTIALEEKTRFVFHASRTSRTIDRLTTLTATREEVTFGDTKEGMLGLRVARGLEQPSNEPEVFVDASGRATTVPVLDNAGVTGVYTSSGGLKGDAVWGTRARWVALSGRVGGEDVVLLMLDHPKNPGHPTHWHARGYGLFAANPFGRKAFTGGREKESPYTLNPADSAEFRHRLLILPGPLSAEKAEAAWRAFAVEVP